MKTSILSLFTALLMSSAAMAQVTLTGTNYTENFDGIGSGLPTGWSVRTGASGSALGTPQTFTTNAIAWSATGSGFRNIAAPEAPLTSGSNTTEQNNSTDRAVGLRQTGNADTGYDTETTLPAFCFQMNNTTGFENFTLAFKLMQADPGNAGRTVTWLVDYGFGAAPTTWTTATTSPTTISTTQGTWGHTDVSVNFGTALDNNASNVWIRVRAAVISTASGSRPHTAIDDFQLNYAVIPPSACAAPSQATNLTFSSVSDTGVTASWTNGGGAGRIVIINTVNSFSTPASGSVPPANATYSGSGQQVVYAGTGNSVNIDGLNPSTPYWFKVFEYCLPDIVYQNASATNNPNSVTTAVCFNNTYFFRTVATGNWHDHTIWQTSVDGNTWTSTLCAPDFNANVISIRNGHEVTLSIDEKIDQLVIQSGATLNVTSGAIINVMDGAGDEITVEDGGVLLYAGGGVPSYLNSNSRIRVQTGGKIQVNTNVSGLSNALAANGSSGRIIYEHESVFQWNVSNVFVNSNQVYFPDVNAATVPTFLLSANMGNVGADNDTRFNGIFEANANITFQGMGEKIFRNGIIGTGTISQTGACGRFRFDGNEAYLGGGGTINLDINRLNVNNGTTVTLVGNHTINSSAANPNNGQIRMTDGSTIDFGPYELSGTGNIRLNSNVVIKTSHPNGMDGAVGGLANAEYVSPQDQTLEFYRNGAQNSGETLPDSCDLLVLGNNTQLLLEKSLIVLTNLFLGTSAILTVGNSEELYLQNSASNAIAGGAITGGTNYIDGSFRWATDNATYVFPVGKNGSGAQGFTITVSGSGDILGYLESNSVMLKESRAYCDIETHPITNGPHSIGQGTAGADGWLDEMIFDLASTLMWEVTNPNGGINSYDITVHANGSNDISPVVAADGTPIRFLMKNGEPGDPGIPTGTTPNFPTTGFFICPTGYTLTGLTSFSSFSIHGSAGSSTTLPVELTHFTATPKGATVALTWETASELNNDFFTVERSIDGLNWEDVLTVLGAGTTTQRSNYSAVDTRPLGGLSYYRLKQTDFDGAFSYSAIRSVFMNTEDKQLINVVNVLGQTVDQNTKGLVIFIYSNGESTKVINE